MEPHIRVRDLNVWYRGQQALKNVSVDIPAQGITAIIGPSGCGKSTLLRSLNRLHDETDGTRVAGEVLLDGVNIYGRGIDVTEVRTRVGMLAPKPYPLPMSIYDNVAYGPRIHRERVGYARRAGARDDEEGTVCRGRGRSLDQVVRCHLESAGLWDEVKDRLKSPAAGLSTGQQQRLCLARALAVEPEVLLCDEPTSALDPHSQQRIETQLQALKGEMTVLIVTHILRQARRIADHVIFMWLGEMVESGPAEQVFGAPRDERTRAYLKGDIG